MPYVVTFEDYTPIPRYDGTPWTQIKIRESATRTGTYALIDTQNLSPVDANPAVPATRDFTTNDATLTEGWYTVTFYDAAGNEQPTSPVKRGGSSLVSVTQLREHVDTDLGDDALQRLIDDAEAEIIQRYGEHAENGTITERFRPMSGERVLFPSRKVDSTQGIVVTRMAYGSEEVVAATPDEYELDGPLELRLLSGYSWVGHIVEVTYTPLTDTPRRERVLVDLVRLALRYEALQSSRMGDASVSHVSYERERDAILGRLSTAIGSFA